jgi:hypothetical protein
MDAIDNKISQVGKVWAAAVIAGNQWASNYWLCTLRTLVRQRKYATNGLVA